MGRLSFLKVEGIIKKEELSVDARFPRLPIIFEDVDERADDNDRQCGCHESRADSQPIIAFKDDSGQPSLFDPGDSHDFREYPVCHQIFLKVMTYERYQGQEIDQSADHHDCDYRQRCPDAVILEIGYYRHEHRHAADPQ